MIIGTEQSLIQLGSIPEIKIKDCYLRRVEKTKTLSLIIDDNLQWHHHIDYICSKVRCNINEGLTPRPMYNMFQYVDAVHQCRTRSATQGNFYRIKTNKLPTLPFHIVFLGISCKS